LTDKDDDYDWLRTDLLEKLEFDLEIGGVLWLRYLYKHQWNYKY
jgi:hypothetical protein